MTGLVEIKTFGSNPGRLRMFVHVPPRLASRAPLVVVLHGCGQTAEGYDHGSGWSKLADERGFALLAPQQRRSNNANGCFNWFRAEDTARGEGEAMSIRQMIQTMVQDHDLDPERIFVTGLSAGGAMTSVMLAAYPEVFAGGALIAGIAYGAAASLAQGLAAMTGAVRRSPRQWGDLVRSTAPDPPRWPRISVWQGGEDRTVRPSNAVEILKQWTDLHGLDMDAAEETDAPDFRHAVWRGLDGRVEVEAWLLPKLEHGAPIDAARTGRPVPFFVDVGVSSTHAIADFWGLTAVAPAPAPLARGLRTLISQMLSTLRRH